MSHSVFSNEPRSMWPCAPRVYRAIFKTTRPIFTDKRINVKFPRRNRLMFYRDSQNDAKRTASVRDVLGVVVKKRFFKDGRCSRSTAIRVRVTKANGIGTSDRSRQTDRDNSVGPCHRNWTRRKNSKRAHRVPAKRVSGLRSTSRGPEKTVASPPSVRREPSDRANGVTKRSRSDETDMVTMSRQKPRPPTVTAGRQIFGRNRTTHTTLVYIERGSFENMEWHMSISSLRQNMICLFLGTDYFSNAPTACTEHGTTRRYS